MGAGEGAAGAIVTCTSESAWRGAGNGASLWRRPSMKRNSRTHSNTDARSSLQVARSEQSSRIVR
eukprot:scaffold22048_cov64-Phaeocystis_antarctica.AAC.2